jgi:hypothetical protein
VTISNQKDSFRLDLLGESGAGASGVLTRAEMQRVLQMLQTVVAKAGWLAEPTKSQAPPTADSIGPKPFRN